MTATRYIDDVVTVWAQTTRFSTGEAYDAAAAPTIKVYEETTDTPILTPVAAKQDDANTTGFYRAQFTASTANGFEVGKTYVVRAEGTVDSVAGAAIIDRFVVRAALPAATLGTLAEVTGYPTTIAGAIGVMLQILANKRSDDGGTVRIYGADGVTQVASFTISEVGDTTEVTRLA